LKEVEQFVKIKSVGSSNQVRLATYQYCGYFSKQKLNIIRRGPSFVLDEVFLKKEEEMI